MQPDESRGAALGGAARLKTVLRPIMGALAVIFVAAAVWDLKRRWTPGAVDVDWGLVALSMPPLALGCMILGLGWVWLLSRMSGVKIPLLPAMALHVESQAARYTPGKVGLPLVRMLGASRLGTTSRIAGSSVLIEVLCFVATGGVCGPLVLIATGDMLSRVTDALGSLGLLALAGFVVTLLLLLLLDRRYLPQKVRDVLQLEGSGPLVPPALPVMHAGYWLTWAAHGYCTSRAIGASSEVALGSMGFYILSPVMGFLALAAPGGLGVREAVVSIALAPATGAAPALYAALLSRGTSVIVDAGVWLALRPFRDKGVRNPPASVPT
jgi:glycosyltransferase 2 family protein